jgi:hypothetical protein
MTKRWIPACAGMTYEKSGNNRGEIVDKMWKNSFLKALYSRVSRVGFLF